MTDNLSGREELFGMSYNHILIEDSQILKLNTNLNKKTITPTTLSRFSSRIP